MDFIQGGMDCENILGQAAIRRLRPQNTHHHCHTGQHDFQGYNCNMRLLSYNKSKKSIVRTPTMKSYLLLCVVHDRVHVKRILM